MFTTLWRQSKLRLQSVMICCWTIVLHASSVDTSRTALTDLMVARLATVLAIHPEYRHLAIHPEYLQI